MQADYIKDILTAVREDKYRLIQSALKAYRTAGYTGVNVKLNAKKEILVECAVSILRAWENKREQEKQAQAKQTTIEYTYESFRDMFAKVGKDEIKNLYRKLATKFHPDINKARYATLAMQNLNRAYEVFSA